MKATIYHPSQFLKENEIYDTGERCPICNKEADADKSVVIQKDPDIFLLKCKHCHGFYASKLPYKEVLDTYYSKYYLSNDLKVTFHKPLKFAAHLLKYIDLNDFKKETVSIIDFGGGGGAISKALADTIVKRFPQIKGVKVIVVDYQSFENYNDGKISVESKKELGDMSGAYDIVMASAVLEHIPNMYDVITKLFSLVDEDGYFYARTPYIEPFMKISDKVDMTYPAHIHDLGDGFWNRVVQTYALNAKIIKSSPSIVETGFKQNFIHALISHAFKFPGHIESYMFKHKKDMVWKYTGGWELFLKFKG